MSEYTGTFMDEGDVSLALDTVQGGKLTFSASGIESPQTLPVMSLDYTDDGGLIWNSVLSVGGDLAQSVPETRFPTLSGHYRLRDIREAAGSYNYVLKDSDMILREWLNPNTGRVLARVTDDGFFMRGGHRFSGVEKPFGSKLWNWGSNDGEGFGFHHFDNTVQLAGNLFVNVFTIPAGAVVWACQLRVLDLATAGGNTNGVGLGPAGSPEKYERQAQIPDFGAGDVPSVLLPAGDFTPEVAAETVRINAVQGGVGMGDTGFIAGSARARCVYEIVNPLEFK